MEQIRGANLGNWLVLEEWMDVGMFEGTGAKDEVWLNRLMDKEELARRMKAHRDSYVTEQDFKDLKGHGVNLVRIPVPFFVFGDRPPFNGCIEYLDLAFQWAEKYGLQVLIDLHTVPGSQNGYDNGGLTGVCKWCKDPEEVEFAMTVLERLARRYVDHPALYGIEVLNEPISLTVWLSSPSGPIRGKPVDKEEAKGSSYVPMKFLKPFYREAYRRLRAILPEEKTIVFHDGFRLTGWNRFFDESGMKNVCLDTHIYIFAMESFVPIHTLWCYQIYVGFNKWKLSQVAKHVPVMVGEWCISNRYAGDRAKKGAPDAEAEARKRYREVAALQMDAWSVSAGYVYWNYQLWRDRSGKMDEDWKESWDLARCWKNGWMPQNLAAPLENNDQ
ncbi:MAG: cellulase family glycosylhydrolase [Clostridiales bacterium]|nr:cellulase family glycosylhydrolase [Clostridiales bacterium]